MPSFSISAGFPRNQKNRPFSLRRRLLSISPGTPLASAPHPSHPCGQRRFHASDLGPSTHLRSILFRRLRSAPSMVEARRLHGLLLVNGFLGSGGALLGSQLVGTYAGLGGLREALLVFYRLPSRNSFACNSILRGMVETGGFSEAVDLYRSMLREGPPPDAYTYPLVLKACSAWSSLQHGREVYRSISFDILQSNVFVQCALVDMFAKCGSLDDARNLFDQMPQRDLVSWTTMMCGTMQNGSWSEALNLFQRMRGEGFGFDSVTMATVIPACGRLGALQLGRGLHGTAVRGGVGSDLCVLNALIDMYCKCGYTRSAKCIFRDIKQKDVVSWSSLVAGHSQNYQYAESLGLFTEMIRGGTAPSSVTLASVLPALAEWKLSKQGKEIHGYALRHCFELDTFVASALIDIYSECNAVRKAEFIFRSMAGRDIAIWNSMIAGYALNGDVELVFQYLKGLHGAGFRPNSVTIVTVLPLCNRLTMLTQGKELHGYVTRNGLDCVVSVNNSLIDMYCKCGYLDSGRNVFEQMTCRDTVTYNTIIAALGMHGHGLQAISFFHTMRKEKIKPDKVTFVALLSACSHAGLVEEGLLFYKSMIHEHGVLQDMEHYSCMVDLYGRSGYLDSAWHFIRKMSVEPHIDVLGSLLGACRVHKRMDLAELVGKWIFEKKPEDPGYYVLLSNIYASSGRWSDVTRVRKMVKERGLVKKPESGRVAGSAPADPDPESGRSRAELGRVGLSRTVNFANLVSWVGVPPPSRVARGRPDSESVDSAPSRPTLPSMTLPDCLIECCSSQQCDDCRSGCNQQCNLWQCGQMGVDVRRQAMHPWTTRPASQCFKHEANP
ncbi:hypothetical protein Taro_051561 [Colocasia esculenta]|uniref:Pentatricopeptide repeat-containing protein n=1 Tax=Colocasia esculenta TaxID=4460 RepID=A0A843XHD8_COLES|nr:hypothetical protein [Colocasia esculenta]